MTPSKFSLKYQDVEHIPAQKLLRLSYAELNSLLQEAERAARRADSIAAWLQGLKIEKSFRYGDDDE